MLLYNLIIVHFNNNANNPLRFNSVFYLLIPHYWKVGLLPLSFTLMNNAVIKISSGAFFV